MSSGTWGSLPRVDSEFGDTTGQSTPERRLLAAILERALLDLVGNETRERNMSQEWIFEVDEAESDEGTYEPYTFAWVCRELDLDVRRTRDLIAKMPRRGQARVAPWHLARQQEAAQRKAA